MQFRGTNSVNLLSLRHPDRIGTSTAPITIGDTYVFCKRSILGILLLGLLLSGCLDRERLNPLDPHNPESGGQPTGLSLSSDKNDVFITWDNIDSESVNGYKVWRKIEGEGDFSVIATLSKEMDNTVDVIPSYDTAYSYKVSAVTHSWESALSDPESIIPGPFNYWIADFGWGALSRISYDGAHILRRKYHYGPIALAIDKRSKSVWVADFFTYWVTKLTFDYDTLAAYDELLSPPIDLKVDERTGDVIVAAAGSSELIRLDASGRLVDVLPCKLTLTRNSRLALDPVGRVVWVAVRDSNTVLKISLTRPHSVMFYRGLAAPSSIAVMRNESVTWVATDSGIVAIDAGNNRVRFLDNSRIVDFAINHERKQVWLIADDRIRNQRRIHILVYQGGNWVVEESREYSQASKIRVNPGSEHPGILLYDAQEKRIVRLDRDWNEIGTLSGFSSQLDITIEQ